MNRSLMTVVAVFALLATGCSATSQTAPAAPTPKVTVQQSASPTPKPGFTQAGKAYLSKLRAEQPRVFTGCPGQGIEESPADVRPNLLVAGMVRFVTPSAEYPDGVTLHRYTNTTITLRHSTKPGWEDEVMVVWSNPNLEFYSIIKYTLMIASWTQSMQADRGKVNQSGFNKRNQATANGDLWFIMAYDSTCVGRQDDQYRSVNWARLFEAEELDLDR